MNVFFDVDGTLVDPLTHQVPHDAIEALKRLREEGHKLGLATGKSMRSIERAQLDQLLPWDYYVTLNGQVLYDHHKCCVYQAPMSAATIQTVLQRGEQTQIPLYFEGEKDFFVGEYTDAVMQTSAFLGEGLPKKGEYHGEVVYNFIAYGLPNAILRTFQDLKDVEIVPGQSSYCDFIVKGINKRTGIERLLRFEKEQHYVAFGDSLNDIEMFQGALFSIAMGDGHVELQKRATHVVAQVSKGGVAEGIWRYLLHEPNQW